MPSFCPLFAPLQEFAEHYGYNLVEAASRFEDAYQRLWESTQAFAIDLLESTGELANDDSLASRYFDYDAFTRDLFMCDYTRTDSGHVFNDNHLESGRLDCQANEFRNRKVG